MVSRYSSHSSCKVTCLWVCNSWRIAAESGSGDWFRWPGFSRDGATACITWSSLHSAMSGHLSPAERSDGLHHLVFAPLGDVWPSQPGRLGGLQVIGNRRLADGTTGSYLAL